MKKTSTGFGPSLIELVVAVALFAVAAAICVRIFAGAKALSDEGARLSRSVIAAQTVAESFKATGGSAEKTARLCGGDLGGEGFTVSYDEDFAPSGGEGRYLLTGAVSEENGVIMCKICVFEDGYEIYAVTAAVQKEAQHG